jgi:hypothetical protein
MELVTEQATLSVVVTKKDGPLTSVVEVASTGPDDVRFKESELTPGPATHRLDPANSYGLLWTVAFARKGTATLVATVTTASGAMQTVKTKRVEGVAGDVIVRMIFVP